MSFPVTDSLPLLLALTGVFSLMVGSFLNVVIHRLPIMMERRWQEDVLDWQRSQGHGPPVDQEPAPPYNLLLPRSACPACGHGITALENIPLLSYLFLRGKCAACGASISPQYPLVELATALLSMAVVWYFGATWTAAAALLLTWALIALAVIDLRTTLLPDVITLPLLWLGLVLNLGGLFTDATSSLLGAVFGYLSLWLVYHGFRLLTGKEGMGHGDFKLLAALGAWLGWQMLPLIILLSSLVGAVVGLLLIAVRGRDRNLPMPFGPYLAAAGWIALLWGHLIVDTYLGMMH
ncbi:leader peptidase (prepilin peptidase) / N-methyltransferase [Ectothiorhodospira magna]|uniref:Prepilin leader peptidase/N-methyltransferase n=1 Tax=Ectothiorhodospira magna TaxID=867345 RepID=A0A1H8Z8I1_9GAMM|nr:A24 family peptidase [Ectothiorhodospira magna]SEP60730.1 leader peptidase (prepilin peptidase) / N-methyltransferase [Ectothiorhodospira magna]